MIEVITRQDFDLLLSELNAIKQKITPTKSSELQIFDNDKAAQLLGVTKRTLQKYRDQGKISFIQEGNKIWYRLSDIEEFLNARHHKGFCKMNKF
jgi:excisionase family DNA binding protein